MRERAAEHVPSASKDNEPGGLDGGADGNASDEGKQLGDGAHPEAELGKAEKSGGTIGVATESKKNPTTEGQLGIEKSATATAKNHGPSQKPNQEDDDLDLGNFRALYERRLKMVEDQSPVRGDEDERQKT